MYENNVHHGINDLCEVFTDFDLKWQRLKPMVLNMKYAKKTPKKPKRLAGTTMSTVAYG